MFKLVNNFGTCTNNNFLLFCAKFLEKEKCRIIEIGPGSGIFAQSLLDKFPDADLRFIDIEDKRSFLFSKPMQISDLSCQRIESADSSIEAILASQVVEHVKNLSFFIRECHRVLKRGGLLVIKLPNYSNIAQRLVFLLRGYPLRLDGRLDTEGHVNFLPYKFFLPAVKEYFEPVEVKGDLFVDSIFTRSIFRLLKKDLFLINDSLHFLSFSWNVMLCLKKK